MTGEVIPFPSPGQRPAPEGVIPTVEQTSARPTVAIRPMSATEYARLVRIVDQVSAYWHSGEWRRGPPLPPRGGKPKLVE